MLGSAFCLFVLLHSSFFIHSSSCSAQYLIRTELRHRVLQLSVIGALPRFLGFLTSAFAQPFEGDITITPRFNISHFGLLLSNPTPLILRQLSRHGYRSAFPACEMIRDRTAIERALEEAILLINKQLVCDPLVSKSSVRARLTHSTAFLSVTDNRVK